MPAFLTDEAKAALKASVEAVEARSCAEVVIAVRDHSGSYLHADLITGGLAAVASVAALLYAPVDFALPWFLIDPLVVGVLVGVLASRLPGLRRLLTPASARAARVQVGAQAAFFARGVRRTRQRIGILVYISLLERSAEVLADDGVIAEVPAEPWAEAVAAIVRQVGAGADGAAVAKAIEGLAPVLEGCLPRAEDDVNELPDEVDA